MASKDMSESSNPSDNDEHESGYHEANRLVHKDAYLSQPRKKRKFQLSDDSSQSDGDAEYQESPRLIRMNANRSPRRKMRKREKILLRLLSILYSRLPGLREHGVEKQLVITEITEHSNAGSNAEAMRYYKELIHSGWIAEQRGLSPVVEIKISGRLMVNAFW